MRDAVNLAWKIARVHGDRSGAALLDRYFEERHPHARELVHWACDVGRLMETFAATEAGREPPQQRVARRSGYGQGRDAPPLEAGVLVEEQVREGAPAGVAFAHAVLRDERGVEVRLDSLLGSGFAVVARDEAALAMSPESRALAERIGLATVVLDGYTHAGGTLDPSLATFPAVVIRPDRYGFGGVEEGWSLDRLIATLARSSRSPPLPSVRSA